MLAQTLSIIVPDKSNENEETAFATQAFVLENGMTVYLNPDPNMTDVFGAVVVRGGANRDAKGAEGTAHYFEHMMFKGSKKIGTIDYKKERPYLDSIRMSYDLLIYSKDDEVFRNKTLKRIDRLSQEAAKYAIPNEFNKVLSGIGGSRINAYTTYENIVYHNHFPAESMDQWISLQVDRFSNPVFRLFQSELETVYEEKNMSMDNTFRGVYEELYRNFYPNSVYGKQTVLGSVESLKTPSISQMDIYFKENYASNNMALIIIGNFDPNKVRSSLDASFGSMRNGGNAKSPIAKEDALQGRVVVKKKLTPIPIGVIGFRSVETGNNDEIILDVIRELLSNENGTGLLDELANKNDLMFVTALSDRHYDIGAEFIAYAPKPFIQSLKNGEKKILEQINRLKTGDFDQQLLDAIKMRMRKDRIMNMEHAEYRSNMIIDAFMTNKSLGALERQAEMLGQIDKAIIQKITKQYYGDNYMVLMSKMGSAKKQKLKKPEITPIKPVNAEQSSAFARVLLTEDYPAATPQFIDFNTDVMHSDLANYLHYYYVNNPMNDIYSIQLKIGVGTATMKDLEVLADYMNRAGTKSKVFSDYRNSLQLTGTSIECAVDQSYFYVSMTGFEYSLSADLQALRSLLYDTEENEDLLKKVVKDYSMEYKFAKKDLSIQSDVLQNYALYGDKSPYLTRLGSKELKKLKVEDILTSLHDIMFYETEIHYVGTKGELVVKGELKDAALFSNKMRMSMSPIFLPLPEVKVSELYFMNNKNAVQSHIRLTIPSKPAEARERFYTNAFNKYFGLGMSSIVFREVREYNSMAYTAYAYVDMPFNFFNPLSLNGAMTTQADKTTDAIDLFTNLIVDMPIQEKSIDVLRTSLLRSFNSKTPSFRYKSQAVAYWMRQGYNEDPRLKQYRLYENLSIDDIKQFYGAFVSSRKYKMSVVGDAERIDMEKLKEEAVYKEVKFKDIYKK